MPSYPGRYDFGVMKQNFGGIQDQASLLTVANGAASDIVNFDLNIGGEIVRRGGTSLIYDFGSPVVFFRKFLNAGVEVFFAITSDGHFWSAAAPAGPWTDRTGSVVWTNFTNPIIGAPIANKLVICNGYDKPVIYVPGSNVTTLEDASLQTTATTSASYVRVGAAGSEARFYGIVGVTPRGETPPVWFDTTGIVSATLSGNTWTATAAAPSMNAKASLTAAVYQSLSWANNGEYTAYKIILSGIVSGVPPYQFLDSGSILVSTVGAAATSFNDTLIATTPGHTSLTTSTAYNTPNDWNTNGQPEGCALVGKNRDERLWAWRKNTVWSSSLSEPTNWMREDDAYVFQVIGGEDTNVTACGGLFDYTFLFSRTATFVYTGVAPTTINLSKVVPVGCASHNSICFAGTDIWWWSNYGPTSGTRVLQGADIAVNTGYANNIQSLIYSGTNTSAWTKIAGEADIVNNKVFWGVPQVGDSTNNQTVVFNYEVKGFTRYEGFDFIGSCVSSNTVYIASSDGKIYQMNSGNTDNGTAITASYTTGDMDMGSYPMVKRMLWVDVLADRRPGNYSFDFQYSADMGQELSTAQTATQTTTNGDTIETTSSTATEHRFYTEGIGNTFKLIFTTSATTPLKLVAWRPEIRARGVRR